MRRSAKESLVRGKDFAFGKDREHKSERFRKDRRRKTHNDGGKDQQNPEPATETSASHIRKYR